MKKAVIFLLSLTLSVLANAQVYGVGSSTTSKTDYFGNTTTTHRDSYGRTTGTSTTGRTDYFGNTTTQQRSNSTSTSIWSWPAF